MVSHATSPFFFWRRNTQNVLQMEGKTVDSGVQQPTTTRLIKSGASVKVSMAAMLRDSIIELREIKSMNGAETEIEYLFL